MWIPSGLIELNNWVNSNKTKCPYNPNTLALASTTDPSTWGTFNKALENLQNRVFSKIGFCFKEGDNIVGIDIDAGLDESGLLNETACDIISACDSFTEYSQNKRGVHIYLKGKLPDNLSGLHNTAKQIEIYQHSRFFVLTGDALFEKELNNNQPAIDYILEKYFKDDLENTNRDIHEPFYKYSYEKPDLKTGVISLKPIYPEIIQGSRNQSLLSLGCQLLSRGYKEEEIKAELLKVNEEKCKPPLEINEIERLIRSVMKYDGRAVY